MGFFSGINYSLSEQDLKNLRQNDDIGNHSDFSNKAELKKAVRELFNNYNCPWCGSNRVNGNNVIVKYGKVNFYREVSYKGFLGGTKYKDELYKTVWRIHEVGLIPGQKSGFLSEGIAPGRIHCKAKGCGWEVKAPVYPKKQRLKWYSIHDVLSGNIFKR